MNCQNCGAPMTLRAQEAIFVCDYCRTIFVPPENIDGVRVLEEEADLNCPICDIRLVAASVYSVPVAYCKRCRGLLFKVAAFQQALNNARLHVHKLPPSSHPFNPAELRRQVNCPSCTQPMDAHPYGGGGNFVIDNCPRCFLNWLDYREFRRAVNAPQRGRRDYDPLAWMPPPISEEDERDEHF